MRFQNKLLFSLALWVAVVAMDSCRRDGKAPPSREVLEQLLQQEAESLKRDGEQVNPSLGVKITWEIQSVEVREQTGNESQPWAGTIRFLITSEQPEYDGSRTTQTFGRDFGYVWDPTLGRWVMN